MEPEIDWDVVRLRGYEDISVRLTETHRSSKKGGIYFIIPSSQKSEFDNRKTPFLRNVLYFGESDGTILKRAKDHYTNFYIESAGGLKRKKWLESKVANEELFMAYMPYPIKFQGNKEFSFYVEDCYLNYLIVLNYKLHGVPTRPMCNYSHNAKSCWEDDSVITPEMRSYVLSLIKRDLKRSEFF